MPSTIRGSIYGDWKRLGLKSEPNDRDNCIHGSNNALEGMRDRLIWIKGSLALTDLYGSRLLSERITSSTMRKIIDTQGDVAGQALVRAKCRDMGSVNCTEVILRLLQEGSI